MRGELREGYIAQWNKYPTDEVKIRVANPSALGPSKKLLKDIKSGAINWLQYEYRFKQEMKNAFAQNEMAVIWEMLDAGINVRLLCYEKNPPCHRFILLELIRKKLDPNTRMDLNLKRLRDAGKELVGEDLPRSMSKRKKQKGTYYTRT